MRMRVLLSLCLQADHESVLATHGLLAQGLAASSKFKAKPGEVLLLPNASTVRFSRRALHFAACALSSSMIDT
jgi:hypothetical protein